VPRAQRFHIATRLLWRRRGDLDWFETVTENVSRSGLLFQSDRLVSVGTEIEMILALSWEAAPWVAVADVCCSGRVARASSSSAKQLSVLATTIESYSFLKER
jgi:hypothetical protein